MMNWTTDKPTEPGWYWFREKRAKGGFFVATMAFCKLYDNFGMRITSPGNSNKAIENVREGSLFAGPIPEPEA